MLPTLLRGEQRFPPAIAWDSQECSQRVSAVSQAQPISAPQSSSMLITSPSLLLMSPFPPAIFKDPTRQKLEDLQCKDTGCCGLVLAAELCVPPAGQDRTHRGFCTISWVISSCWGRSSHGSADGAMNGRGRRLFCTQAKLQKTEKTILYKLLSSFPVPSSLIRNTGDWGKGGGRNHNTKRKP